MDKNQIFIKRVYELIAELKIPLIDDRTHYKVKLKTKNSIAKLIFRFEDDESIIRGFLGLCDYFHTVVIKDDDKFYIPQDKTLFILESA